MSASAFAQDVAAPPRGFPHAAGGSFAFASRPNTSITFLPAAGKNLSDRLAVGVFGGVRYRKTNAIPTFQPFDQRSTAYTIGAFVRNYAFDIAPFGFFLQTGLGFTSEGTSFREAGQSDYTKVQASNALNLSVTPNLCYVYKRVRFLANFGGIAVGNTFAKKAEGAVPAVDGSRGLSVTLSTQPTLGVEILF